MTSDFLYRFVQNMDKGELRHCRQTLSSDKAAMEHGYLAMFDALTAMKTFDASHLNDAVKDYPASRHLAVAKVRLYQLVLTNLKQLHSARKNANDPWLRYEEAQILMDMNMLDEAIEVLQKGLEQAVNREDLFMEVPLRDQLRLALKRKGGKDNVNLRTENEYLLVQAAEKLATFTRYSQLADRMFDYVRKYRVSDSEGVKRGVAELMARPEVQNINLADSLPSQLRYYFIWQMYHSHRNELERSTEMNRRLVKLREDNADRVVMNPMDYRTDLANLVGKLVLLKEYAEAERYLPKLESIPVVGRRQEVTHFCEVEIQHMLFYMNTGQLDKVLDREERILDGLKRYQSQMTNNTILTMLYNLGVTHMVLADDGRATHYFDRIRNMGHLAERTDLQGISRLLRLLLLCEDKDHMNFGHFLRNSKRFFGKGDRFYDMESTVYEWLREHAPVVGTMEKRASFKNLTERIRSYLDRRILGAEEIMLWSSAKARGIPMKKVFEEQLAVHMNK